MKHDLFAGMARNVLAFGLLLAYALARADGSSAPDSTSNGLGTLVAWLLGLF